LIKSILKVDQKKSAYNITQTPAAAAPLTPLADGRGLAHRWWQLKKMRTLAILNIHQNNIL